jgi:hypothetical protein
MKEKKKKEASDVVVLLLIRWERFPCSVETCGALIFWPLHPLVRHVMAMP